VPIDRAATLRNAEKLLRQGKLEPAVLEYLKVVEEHPQDWATANTLGDLYVRVGQQDKAVEQFARIAANLGREGFLPKAGAVYKKILKLRPNDENALLQAGEVAAKQGLLGDARAYLNQVIDRRNDHGDRRGAAEIRIRLGALDPDDIQARLVAARAQLELDVPGAAIRDFRVIAAHLREKGRLSEAADVLAEAVQSWPESDEVRGELFAAYVASGDLERARSHATTPDRAQALARAFVATGDAASAAECLPAEDAEGDLHLLLQAADRKLRSGSVEEGLGTLRQLLNQDPKRASDITALGLEIGRTLPDVGFPVVAMAAETALIEADWAAAAAGLQEFAARVPGHIPALLRLIEICVDGELESLLTETQARLADAYLAAGSAAEARAIAEDLIARAPDEGAHAERLRVALQMLGVPDPAQAIADRVQELSLPAGASLEGDALAAAGEVPAAIEPLIDASPVEPPVAPPPDDPEATVYELETVELGLGGDEVDLTTLVEGLTRDGVRFDADRTDTVPVESPDLDAVFQRFRDEASGGAVFEHAEQEYARGIGLAEAGRVEEAIVALFAASRSPLQRARAGAALARLYLNRGDAAEAIEWLERAAEAPTPSPEEANAVLYDLAVLLESVGEVVRALAVCLELQASAGGYRDVAARIERLSKSQVRG
jgi:tetratricopeptide (TPR) repeat protein